MKSELSVLIPSYNSDFRKLVKSLSSQLSQLSSIIRYEIIVADDGSTDRKFLSLGDDFKSLPHFTLITRKENVGRAAIRNFLAQQAHYQWLVFLDCDMSIENSDFIIKYLSTDEEQKVVCGGYQVGAYDSSNLRYIYEKSAVLPHCAQARNKRPYQHFFTANFMVNREVMLSYPFDERFRTYGYEDVLFGKQLKKNHISISHIDNIVGLNLFESNEHFVSKTEEGLQTLFKFHNELRGYSQILTFVEGIHLNAVRGAIRLWHKLFGRIERKILCGKHPRLCIFKLYKLGYFVSI